MDLLSIGAESQHLRLESAKEKENRLWPVVGLNSWQISENEFPYVRIQVCVWVPCYRYVYRSSLRSSLINKLLWIYTIQLTLCSNDKGPVVLLVRASDWNSESLGLNPGYFLCIDLVVVVFIVFVFFPEFCAKLVKLYNQWKQYHTQT